GIAERGGEGLRLAQHREDTPQVARRLERRAQGKAQVDGLFTRVAMVWEMREDTECLLEVLHSLAVGRPHHSLLPRLSAVHQGLVPHFTPQGMMRQALDLLSQAV